MRETAVFEVIDVLICRLIQSQRHVGRDIPAQAFRGRLALYGPGKSSEFGRTRWRARSIRNLLSSLSIRKENLVSRTSIIAPTTNEQTPKVPVSIATTKQSVTPCSTLADTITAPMREISVLDTKPATAV